MNGAGALGFEEEPTESYPGAVCADKERVQGRTLRWIDLDATHRIDDTLGRGLAASWHLAIGVMHLPEFSPYTRSK